MERDDAARGHGGVDARLRAAHVQRSGSPQPAHVRAERPERPRNRGFHSRESEKHAVVEIITDGHSIVIREDHEGVAGGAVALEDGPGIIAAVGARSVTVQLGLTIGTRGGVRAGDPDAAHTRGLRVAPRPIPRPNAWIDGFG